MKKFLCLALGAMLLALLPMGNAQGQNKTVQLAVKTLDHRGLASARIYAAENGVSYFIDSTHLAEGYTGTALPLDSIHVSMPLITATNTTTGNPVVSQINVDSATYARSFIVARDVMGDYYVMGNVVGRANGVFAGTNLFDGVYQPDSLIGTITVSENMIMAGKVIVADLVRDYLYTSIATAMADSYATQLVFLDTVRLDSSIVINRNLTVNQMSKPLVSDATTAGYLFSVGGTNVVDWRNGKIVSAAGNHFRVVDNAILKLTAMTDTAATTVAAVSAGGKLQVSECTFATTGSAAVVTLSDSSSADMDGVNISGGSFGITIPAASKARLDIDEQSVLNGFAGYTKPINADSYTHSADNAADRVYFRGLKRTAAVAAPGDSVHLVSDMAASTTINDTIENPVVLDLAGFTSNRELYLLHNDGTVTVANGTLNSIASAGDAAGVVEVHDVDLTGTINAATQRQVKLVSGRYSVATPFVGDAISIEGGKFADTTGCTVMLAPRHGFVANTDVDAAEYPYMVADGYAVTYINYDCKNHDTVIYYNTPDNRISPVLSEPRYEGTDTVFLAFVRENGDLLTAWQHDVDVLSSDTTLYAMWAINGVTFTYKTRYNHISLEGDTLAVDSVSNVAPAGSALRIRARHYAGRVPNTEVINITSLVSDTVVDFYYTLVKYELTWAAQPGRFSDDTFVKTDSLHYGDAIVFPEDPVLRGYSFVEWIPNDVTTMPEGNLTMIANYNQETYNLTWIGADTTVTYIADTIDVVSAILVDSVLNDTIATTLTFVDTLTGDVVNPVIKAGAYRVTARLDEYADVYILADSTTLLTVVPAPLTFNAIEVATEKPYDGNTAASINGDLSQVLGGVLANDDVHIVSATATYDTPDTGSNKTINVRIEVGGADAANYTPLVKDSAIANCVIFMPVTINTDVADSGIAVDASGYCAGTGAINVIVRSGSPDEYVLYFEDDNFADIDTWSTIANVSNDTLTLDIVVPEGVNNGTYTAWLRLRNSNHSAYVSDSIRIQFRVNLPRTYTMPLFDDVIALVDTCHCFTNIQWYRDGVAIPGANGYYYQEAGGLAGHTYHVSASMNGVAMATCEQTDVTTQIADNNAAATVSVYPNPTTQTVTVNIANSNADVHTLRVMNVMGVTMESSSFDGESVTVDMSRMANGSYTVSVDGIVVRVIKK